MKLKSNKNNNQSSLIDNQLENALYLCRENFTNSPFFMQNKPNVKSAENNISSFVTSKYEKMDNW
jgi:hypothetical protein